MPTQPNSTSAPTVVLAVALALLIGSAAAADVLVLRSGETIETRGSWEQRGQRIVYTSADGTLVSIRAEEVDLEATRRKRERVAAEPASTLEEKSAETAPTATIEITNRDVGGARRPIASRSDDGEEGDEDSPPANRHRLEVTEFREELGAETGIVLNGTLANRGNATAVGIEVHAQLLDAEARTLEVGSSRLSGVRLEPGESTLFSLALPDGPRYDSIRFEVTSIPLQRRTSATTVGSDDGASESDADQVDGVDSEDGPPAA